MAKILIVDNTPYLYPEPNDDPGWGEGATGWAEAVTELLGDLFGPGDIKETTFTIPAGANSGNVAGLLFDSTVISSAIITYNISQGADAGLAESGTIHLLYDDSSIVGEKWRLSQETNGDAEVDFDINQTTGQFTYSSSASSTASRTMKFRAKTLSK